MSRLKKKPDFSTKNIDNRLLSQAAQYYQKLIKDEMYTDICDAEIVDIERDVSYDDEEAAYKYVILTAEAFRVSPMKMRKLLITAGVYSTVTSRLIDRLRKEGKNINEIQEMTGLKRSSVNGYLPYNKVIYNHLEKSVGADRIGLYRRRQKLIKNLQEKLSEEALWESIIEFQGFLFHTASGLPFKYTIKVGRTGTHTKELLVDRREESKTLAWSSIALAFKNAIVFDGIVNKPKALGDIRGISYIYPIFYHFGLIQVPEKSKVNMDGKNPKKKGL